MGDQELVTLDHSSLVGGVIDPADPAIALIEVQDPANLAQHVECTANFIATTVLITAAHCVTDANGQPLPSSTIYRVYAGVDFVDADPQNWMTVQAVHPHPQYNPNGFDPNSNAHDIAVIVIESPAEVTLTHQYSTTDSEPPR